MLNPKYILNTFKSIKSQEKIIIIESDDWGSERVPNSNVREELKKNGINMESSPYSKFDTLERLEDMEMLEHLLSRIEIEYKKKVKITTNFIIQNPDFSKIKQSDYKDYYAKSFIETYLSRDNNNKVWDKIKDLKEQQFIKPQFHGREHINIPFWLNELQNNNKKLLNAFDLGCFAIDHITKNNDNLLSSFQYNNLIQKEFVKNSFKDGYNKFHQIFGFTSKSIVVPRHVWHPDLNLEFKAVGVKFIQSAINQEVINQEGFYKIKHYTGEIDKISGLRFLVRNVYFEPSYDEGYDWVQKALNKINFLFYLNVPVIISMHRLNFVGGLCEKSRDKNIKLFEKLLIEIIKKHKEVKFLTSDEFYQLKD